MHNEQWIFGYNFSVFGWIEKSLNGWNALKAFISNSRKLSWQKFYNFLMWEFTSQWQYACRNAEMNLKSTITKYQQI